MMQKDFNKEIDLLRNKILEFKYFTQDDLLLILIDITNILQSISNELVYIDNTLDLDVIVPA